MTHEELKARREAMRRAEEERIALMQPKPLTAKEKAIKEKKRQISRLKLELSKSDYKALKYAEGWITEEEYASIKAERQALRDQINELESEL